ncbi:hypothetical protein BC835DRAFT_1300973 [Cytidiella melzeri]|nr:hypothetical protein BC835DRAFT_1300973 [Cytidiella melzeri]
MQVALQQSLEAGCFVDAKFYVFSRRRSTGFVDQALPVYANSAILRASATYFEALFGATFSEARMTSLSGGFPEDRTYSTTEYDYEADSDLEDEEPNYLEEQECSGGTLANSDLPLKNPGCYLNLLQMCNQRIRGSLPTGYEQARGRSGGPPWSSLRHIPMSPTHGHGQQGLTGDNPPLPLSATEIASMTNTQLMQVTGTQYGHVIVTPDVAYKTFKALVYYLYTGELRFAPLRSQSPKPGADTAVTTPRQVPQCSPKAMYRLADKYGLIDLKDKAQADIMHKLSVENIAVELRSTLTSTYEQVRDLQVAFACKEACRPAVLATIHEWTAELAKGNAPLTAGVLADFVQKAVAPPPPPPPPPVDPGPRTEVLCWSCRTHNPNVCHCTKCGDNSQTSYLGTLLMVDMMM